VRLHPRCNTSRGLIFLSEFDIDGIQLFKEELRRNFNVSEIEQAELIKETFQGARQMLQSNREAPNQKPKPIFPTHFDVTFAIEPKRKISPVLLMKCIQNHTGTKPFISVGFVNII